MPARYAHLFNTQSEFEEAYNGNKYIEPWVSYTLENEKVDYNKPSVSEKLIADAQKFKVNGHSPVGIMTAFPDETHAGYIYDETVGAFFDATVEPSRAWCMFSAMTNEWITETTLNPNNWQNYYLSGPLDENAEYIDIPYDNEDLRGYIYIYDVTPDGDAHGNLNVNGPLLVKDDDSGTCINPGYYCDGFYKICIKLGNEPLGTYWGFMPYIWG